jgi:hypothetical protein
LNTTAASFSPPPRSHACSVLLNHLIIVHGGKRVSVHLDDSPWMFNTISNQWSPLLSAKTQQSIPSPRWGHACLLLPTPGKSSSLATSMYLQGGISTITVSICLYVLPETLPAQFVILVLIIACRMPLWMTRGVLTWTLLWPCANLHPTLRPLSRCPKYLASIPISNSSCGSSSLRPTIRLSAPQLSAPPLHSQTHRVWFASEPCAAL